MKIQINENLLKSLLVMASVVEARDPYTGGHLWRVSQYAKLVATRIGLSTSEITRITLGGFLHDLGKIGIPDATLIKPESLTAKEYDTIKTHPAIGSEIIKQHPLGILIHDAIRHHHERIDGQGYPDKLHQDNISIDARIISIADAFDAMTSTRPYRQGMPIDIAFAKMKQEKDIQFDGTILDYFIDPQQSDAIDHIIGHSDINTAMVTCPKCGPVITVTQNTRDGDIAYCKPCHAEFRLHRDNGIFKVELLSHSLTAEQLRPEAEMSPIDALINQAQGAGIDPGRSAIRN